MSFYGHNLDLPIWFGVGCWHFALAGLVMVWTTVPQFMLESPSPSPLPLGLKYPYYTVALLLILAQSPLSFLADYVHMTNDSYWHVVDRCMAVPLMGTEVLKFALMCHHCYSNAAGGATTNIGADVNNNSNNSNSNINSNGNKQSTNSRNTMHPGLVLGYGVAMVLAVFAFRQSTTAQSNLDRDAFVFWHYVWHAYPLVVSSIILFDFYVCDGWKRSTRKYFYAVELHIILGPQRNNKSLNGRIYKQQVTKTL